MGSGRGENARARAHDQECPANLRLEREFQVAVAAQSAYTTCFVTDPSTARSRAWVEVDLDALRRNAQTIRSVAGSEAALVPMVKADAYGLGMNRVVAALLPEQPWAFGVAAVAEGEALRRCGWRGPAIVFAPVAPGEYTRAVAANLTLCLSDVEAVQRWVAAGRSAGQPVAFHTEIDTGMGRAGFSWSEAAEWGAAVSGIAGSDARWEGCFTHFHSADEPVLAPADKQWQRFEQALRSLPPPQDGVQRLIHAANSAAALRRPEYARDLVRPGIFLYGGEVGAESRPRAVAALRARVVLVRDVPAGTTLGYGATYQAARSERWATLGIGYGDGLRRALGPAGGEVLIRGKRAPIIGRISMDVTVVNVASIPDVVPGDVATLIGRDGNAEIRLDDVAVRCGTISYEILTGLGPRLPRVYDRL